MLLRCWDPFEAASGSLMGTLGSLEGLVGITWRSLCRLWKLLGSLWRLMGSSIGPLRVISGLVWERVGPFQGFVDRETHKEESQSASLLTLQKHRTNTRGFPMLLMASGLQIVIKMRSWRRWEPLLAQMGPRWRL